MTIIFFLMLLGLGIYFVYKLIGPELNITLERPFLNLPWRKRQLKEDIADISHGASAVVEDVDDINLDPQLNVVTAEDKILRLEQMLREKNSDIDRLNLSLENERKHRIEFEKTQTILQEEITRLKKEVKKLRGV